MSSRMALAINKDIITGICDTVVIPWTIHTVHHMVPGAAHIHIYTWIDIKCLGYTTLRVCLPMCVTVIRVTTTYLLKCSVALCLWHQAIDTPGLSCHFRANILVCHLQSHVKLCIISKILKLFPHQNTKKLNSSSHIVKLFDIMIFVIP